MAIDKVWARLVAMLVAAFTRPWSDGGVRRWVAVATDTA